LSVRHPFSALRSRIETIIGELSEALGLTRHRAETLWELLTPAAILAHALLRRSSARSGYPPQSFERPSRRP